MDNWINEHPWSKSFYAARKERVKMKYYLLILFILLSSVAYADEIRQDFIPDINGNPTYTVTDDQGQTVATISQFFLKDINGNKVYEIDKAPNLELE